MIDGMYKVRRSLVNNFDCMGRIFIYIPYIEDSTNEKLISWRVRLMIGECSFYGFDTTLVAFSLLLSLDRPMDEFGRNKLTVRVEFMNINRRHLYNEFWWPLSVLMLPESPNRNDSWNQTQIRFRFSISKRFLRVDWSIKLHAIFFSWFDGLIPRMAVIPFFQKQISARLLSEDG